MSAVTPPIGLHHDLGPSKLSRDTQETKACDVHVYELHGSQASHDLIDWDGTTGEKHQAPFLCRKPDEISPMAAHRGPPEAVQ
jgi:hypothetical protein